MFQRNLKKIKSNLNIINMCLQIQQHKFEIE